MLTEGKELGGMKPHASKNKDVIAIRCDACGKLHEKKDDSDDYLTFHGNVTVGEKGGIIGNCDVIGPRRYCRTLKCLGSISHFIDDLIKPTTRQGLS